MTGRCWRIANRIRNELRRRAIQSDASVPLDGLASSQPSPLDWAVTREGLDAYERALAALDDNDRAAIIGRFEMGYSYDALARAMDRPSSDAARKHTERALRRLLELMDRNGA